MKNLGAIIFALCFMLAMPAAAQDVFQGSGKSFLPTDLLYSKSPHTKKHYTDRYYKDCGLMEHPLLTEETKPLFCSCVTAHMNEILTLQDMNYIFDQTPEGDKQRRRISKLTYGPCMTQPLHALIYNDCADDENLKTGLAATQRKVCQCVAGKTAEHWRKFGLQNIGRYSNNKIRHLDPVLQYLNNDVYARNSQAYMVHCIAGFGPGSKKTSGQVIVRKDNLQKIE